MIKLSLDGIFMCSFKCAGHLKLRSSHSLHNCWSNITHYYLRSSHTKWISMYLCIIYGRGQRGDQKVIWVPTLFWLNSIVLLWLISIFFQWNFPTPQNWQMQRTMTVTGEDLCDLKDLGKTSNIFMLIKHSSSALKYLKIITLHNHPVILTTIYKKDLWPLTRFRCLAEEDKHVNTSF